LQEKSVITRQITVAAGVFAPGHIGELTQVVDFALVDDVLEQTGATQRRLRLLASRVVVYFVLALALFEKSSYQAVWGKLIAGLAGLPLVRPSTSALSRARRRIGTAPLKMLFETIAGPVAWRDTPGAFWRGWRTVAIDGTTLHVPDCVAITARYPKRTGKGEFGYPLLRLLVMVECGTRALLDAAFGPEDRGELGYARQMLSTVGERMLVLADAGFDAWEFLRDLQQEGAAFLVRSSARRCPTISTRLRDGSYLARLGGGKLLVRVIEAWITVTLADGTVRREQWRLITSLTDPVAYPARELVDLYHQRWQIETTYFSIKATMLDGRVLRSARPDDIDQEVYALLTAYQALIRIAADAAGCHPGLDMDRISFTVLLEAARDQVTTAAGVTADEPGLVGAIGRAVLGNLLPARRRRRVKARTRKNAVSKYAANIVRAPHPATAQAYTVTFDVMVMEEGLTSRSRA
jgi:hypothetical protein